MAQVRIEFTGSIEIPTQGWTEETKLNQIKKQAQDTVDHWTIMVQKGNAEPVPVNFIKMNVTHVILDI